MRKLSEHGRGREETRGIVRQALAMMFSFHDQLHLWFRAWPLDVLVPLAEDASTNPTPVMGRARVPPMRFPERVRGSRAGTRLIEFFPIAPWSALAVSVNRSVCRFSQQVVERYHCSDAFIPGPLGGTSGAPVIAGVANRDRHACRHVARPSPLGIFWGVFFFFFWTHLAPKRTRQARDVWRTISDFRDAHVSRRRV